MLNHENVVVKTSAWWRPVLKAPVARRTWAATLYMVVGLPLALVGCFFAVASLVLGAGLAVTFVGLPLLALGGLAARRLGAAHRALARVLLDERVAAPPRFEWTGGFFGWLQAALKDGPSWRARAYLLVKLPVAIVTFYLTVLFWVQGLVWLTYPIWWQLSGPGRVPEDLLLDVRVLIFRGGSYDGRFEPHQYTIRLTDNSYLDTWPRVLLVSLAGIVCVLAAPWVVRAVTPLERALVRGLLGPATGPARVRELETARAQVVEDSASTLRRIERDLHDGTQAQLATLAMTLGQAKEKLEHRPDVPFDPDGALGLIDTAHRHAKEALVELRDIARGIHPPALDVGLDAALSTLVTRSAVPTVLNSDIPIRPAKAIEAIAYFSVAELLANVAKHSQARHAIVDALGGGGMLRLRVSDDGVGGALPGGGSGLLGLADRVRAVDGHLDIASPPGGPTVVSVRLPLHT